MKNQFKKYMEDAMKGVDIEEVKESFLYKKGCEISDQLDKMEAGTLPVPDGIVNEYTFEAKPYKPLMPNGEEFKPCPECGNHLHINKEATAKEECCIWLLCLVCDFDCIQ